ncbi:MAG: bifunctional diaminohydroxyphosphoribosylaminopyrimidine deaminase/5-amino-6-(5-phosphoribosylamino)uracil reductase RibD [Halanaerobiales bacterium]|nr:bifunctional diaminohydroxyphosphoribosylaminopyrimidine deaminase/5-amino-6-(5-phosphoribosylamino)uracil reductase RibD [Halanaerobiales bacterium]
MNKRDDEYYMKKTLKLAAQGEGYTSPNPLVGAVVVKDDEIVGKGYHKKAGEPHAEVHALNQAGEKAEGATLYVNLEPCCHLGKTPACSLKIINSKISRLVVAMEDPNPVVAGKGIKDLAEAGIEIKTGVLEQEAKELNEIFIKYMTEEEPFVYLKTGQTLDGYLATRTGDSRWVTNEAARKYGHQLRHKVDGILVGVGTVISDNPRLTTRLEEKEGKDPIRIVLDSKLRTPVEANIINEESESPTFIITTEEYDRDKYAKLDKINNLNILVLPKDENGKIELHQLLKKLYQKEITSVLIEGGGKVNHSFLKSGLIDKVYCFIAPKLLGGNDGIASFNGSGVEKMNNAYELQNIEYEMLDGNLLCKGEIGKE